MTNVLGGIIEPHTSATGARGAAGHHQPPGQTPHVLKSTQIGSGFSARTDPAALVIGPTGVGLGLTAPCTSPTR